MKRIFPAIILMSLFIPSAFAGSNNITTEDLKYVQPAADSFSGERTLGGITYFEAERDGKLIGYCVEAKANGYGGPMLILAGVDTAGIIQGTKIISHAETEGIGCRITERCFQDQFKGKDASRLAIGKNIDAVTGATISSKVFTDSINDTVKRLLVLLPGHEVKLQK